MPSPSGISAEIASQLTSILSAIVEDSGSGTAIAFSGGLDSSVLMAASSMKLKAYTAGFPDSMDLKNSRESASFLGLNVTEIFLDVELVARYRDIVRRIDPGITPTELGYEIVLSAILDNVHEETVVTGQGADEIFYGYRRFLDEESLDNSAYLMKLHGRTLPREMKIAAHFGKQLETPFLHPQIVKLASSAPRSEHISQGRNKVLLRNAARLMGVPEAIAERPKKAAQYGSGVSKALRRIPG